VVASDLLVSFVCRRQIHVDGHHNSADCRKLLKIIDNPATFPRGGRCFLVSAGLSQRPSASAMVRAGDVQTSLAVAGNAG